MTAAVSIRLQFPFLSLCFLTCYLQGPEGFRSMRLRRDCGPSRSPIRTTLYSWPRSLLMQLSCSSEQGLRFPNSLTISSVMLRRLLSCSPSLSAIVVKGASLDENRRSNIAARSSENRDKLHGLLRRFGLGCQKSIRLLLNSDFRTSSWRSNFKPNWFRHLS